MIAAPVRVNRSVCGRFQASELYEWEPLGPVLTVVVMHPLTSYLGVPRAAARKAFEYGFGAAEITYLIPVRANHYSEIQDAEHELTIGRALPNLTQVLVTRRGPVLAAWGPGPYKAGEPWDRGVVGRALIDRFWTAIDTSRRSPLCAGLECGQPRAPLSPLFNDAAIEPFTRVQ